MSLREKVLLLLIGFGVLPLLIFSLVFIRGIEKKLITERLTDLSFIASLVDNNIQALLDEAKGRVVDWTSDGEIKKELALILREKSEDARSVREERLAEYIKRWKLPLDSSVLGTEIIGTDGSLLVSTFEQGPDYQGFDSPRLADALRIAPKEAIITREPSEVSKKEGMLFHVTSPIIDLETDEKLGFMVNHVTKEGLNDYLQEIMSISWEKIPEIKDTFEVYLVDNKMTIFTETRFGKTVALETLIDTPVVRKCVNEGSNLSGVYDDYRGVRVFGASNCVKNRWWMTVAETDESEILKDAHQLRRGIFLTLLAVLVLFVLVTFLLTRSFSNIMRDEIATIRKIASGEFKARLPVRGRDELSQINSHVNAMAQELINYLKEARSAHNEAERQKKAVEQKMRELEKFTKLTVQRELKMIEMKKKLKKRKKGGASEDTSQ